MQLLEGITIYELILMVLGVAIALAILFIFVYTAIKKEPNTNLIYAFVVPGLMIAYPSIKKLQFDKGVVTLDTYATAVETNPLDTASQRLLNTAIQTLPDDRAKDSPTAMSAKAKGQIALGRYDDAQQTIQDAWKVDSSSPQLREIRNTVFEKQKEKKHFDQNLINLNNVSNRWDRNRNNPLIRDSIYHALQKIDGTAGNDQTLHVDPQQIIQLAKAAAIAGNKDQALSLLNNLIKTNPDFKEASTLANQINNNFFDKKIAVQMQASKVKAQVKRTMTDVIPPAPAQPVHPSDTVGLHLVRFIPRSIYASKEN